MRNFFSGNKFKITVCICLALMLGIFVAAVSDSGASPLSSVLSFIMEPLDRLAVSAAQTLENFNADFVSAGRYAEKIDELNSELDNCRKQLVDYENLKYKLAAYEEFLEVREKNPDYKFVPASVILHDDSDVYGSFTLNCGTDDGLNINDPVIFGNNLIGVVREVTASTATVYTLFNPSVSVGAYEIRTREDCYVEKDSALAAKGLLKISGLSKSTPVVSGGIVCSSGIGGIYPRDLIIGTVSEVVNDATAITAYAVVEPDVDASQVTDVFVITDFTGKAEG